MNSNFFIDSESGFICYKTTETDLKLASIIVQRDFAKTNLINAKTVYDRKGSRMAGILGEIVFKRYMIHRGMKAKFVGRGSVPYDFIVTTAKGSQLKVDVKCKLRSVPPSKSFEASFFKYQSSNYFQEVNFYAFLSTTKNFDKVWLCGLSSKKHWLENPHGKLWKAGDVDPSNGMTFRKDTWSVSYQYLTPFI